MKRDSGSARLSLSMLFFGIVALVLRRNLYATAVDVKGLLLRYQPLEIALLVLTAGVMIRIVLAARKQEPSGDYEDCYKADLLSALGAVAGGAGILMTADPVDSAMVNYLALACHYLRLAAPVCLLLAGIARAVGKKAGSCWCATIRMNPTPAFCCTTSKTVSWPSFPRRKTTPCLWWANSCTRFSVSW